MFERFTQEARRIVVLAQEAARELNHTYIGTEHILLALLSGEGAAHQALMKTSGVTHETVLEQIEQVVGKGTIPMTVGHIPFTPSAKRVLEYSMQESVRLGSTSIVTGHLLLGLLEEVIVREPPCVAASVLRNLGVDTIDLGHLVMDELSGIMMRVPGGITVVQRGSMVTIRQDLSRADSAKFAERFVELKENDPERLLMVARVFVAAAESLHVRAREADGS